MFIFPQFHIALCPRSKISSKSKRHLKLNAQRTLLMKISIPSFHCAQYTSVKSDIGIRLTKRAKPPL